MLSEITKILEIGFLNGILWFPFVLTIGLLYRYLKFIDVSIDGIAVINCIVFTITWNNTHSLVLGLITTIGVSAILYSLVSLLIYELKINNLLAGIIFTLVLHSISVVLVGESLTLDYETLPFLSTTGSILLISFSLAIITDIFFRTNIGIKIKVSSDNYNANVAAKSRILILLIYVFCGVVLSIGSILYTSRIGMSRSGGSFEFLISSLCSFLFVDRIINYVIGKLNNPRKGYSHRLYIVFSIFQSPVFKALVGSILFQIIILFIIFYTANPAYWKLIFGIILLFTIAAPKMKYFKIPRLRINKKENGVILSAITFEYHNGYEIRKIFCNLNCKFENGITIIWGNNGTGKTTLLKLLNGELRPTKGRIYKNGTDITNYSKNERSIFSINQNPYNSLSTNSTVYENIIAAKKFRFIESLRIGSISQLYQKGESAAFIDQFKFDSSLWVQQVGNLSGGQAQKINLFISTIAKADIILGDEPTSGMDDINFKLFLDVLDYLKNKNVATIIVTHDKRLKEYSGLHYSIQNGKINATNYEQL